MTTPQSDTLRTDAETLDVELGTSGWMTILERTKYPDGSGDYVTSNFARTLERELNDALCAKKYWHAEASKIQTVLSRTEKQLTDAQARVRELEAAQPPAPQYLDRPTGPGHWWQWSEDREEWDAINVMPTVTGRYDYSPAGIWLPATPPPPPIENPVK
jgi:hypothetical protein